MTHTTPEGWKVVLAEEGTPMATFQKVRTDAISQMFDTKRNDEIYHTSKFFAQLDNCVEALIAAAKQEGIVEGERRERERILKVIHDISRTNTPIITNLKGKQDKEICVNFQAVRGDVVTFYFDDPIPKILAELYTSHPTE